MRRYFAALLLLALWIGFAHAAPAPTPDILPESTPESYFVLPGRAEPTESPAEAGPAEQPGGSALWTYPISQEILADPLDILLLVNKENLLAKDYPPKDDLHQLVEVKVKKTSSSPMQVRQVMYGALESMFAAAEEEGIKLYVKSAHRAYQTQAVMYENRIKSLGRDDGVVQKEGASEHQTGLAVDVLNWEWRDKKMNKDFAKTKEGQWMAENCARFGFIIRYPEGKEDITGITYEPYHLRYVGKEAAVYMTENNLTLEEFTVEWKSALSAYQEQSQWNTDVETETFSF